MEKVIFNNQLEKILQGIFKCGNQTQQAFKTAMLRNGADIKEELTKLKETMNRPEGWDKFKEQEQAIVDLYVVEFDQMGRPVFGENASQADREFLALKKDNRDLLVENRKKVKEFESTVMEQPTELKLRFILEGELPSSLTLEQELGISDLIIFDKEKKKK